MTVDPPPPPSSRPGYRVQTIGAYGANQNELEPPKRSGPSSMGSSSDAAVRRTQRRRILRTRSRPMTPLYGRPRRS